VTSEQALKEISAELELARAAIEAGDIGQAICHAVAAQKWLGYSRGILPISTWPALDLIAEAANEVTHQVCQVAEGRCAVMIVRAPRGALAS